MLAARQRNYCRPSVTARLVSAPALPTSTRSWRRWTSTTRAMESVSDYRRSLARLSIPRRSRPALTIRSRISKLRTRIVLLIRVAAGRFSSSQRKVVDGGQIPDFHFGKPGSGLGRYRDERPAGTEKATVLLLHGWAGTSELNWSHVYAPLVAAGYRVLAPDLAGHGRGARDVPFTIEGVTEMAARLVRDSGTGKVVVAGHSMGASMAMAFARRHPDQVLGLVLMATQASWPGIPPDWLLRAAGRVATVAAKPILRWGARSILGEDPVRNRWIHEELSHTSIVHLSQALAALRGFNAEPWLTRLRFPVVVLVTTRDGLVPPERQRHLAAAIPGAFVMDVDIDHSDPPSRPGHFPERLVAAIGICLEARSTDSTHAPGPSRAARGIVDP